MWCDFCSFVVINCSLIIEVATTIAVLSTAVAALANILILKSQQRSAHKPHILPQNGVYVIRNNKDHVPFIVSQGTEQESEPIYAMHIAPYHLRNVGLGPATSVKVVWKYKKEKIREKLVNAKNIEQNYDEPDYYIFKNSQDRDFGFTIEDESMTQKNISSITANETLQFYIPSTILNFIVFYLDSQTKGINESIAELNYDEVTIKIVYNDISGRKIVQNVKVEIYGRIIYRDDATPGSDHGIVIFQYSNA